MPTLLKLFDYEPTNSEELYNLILEMTSVRTKILCDLFVKNLNKKEVIIHQSLHWVGDSVVIHVITEASKEDIDSFCDVLKRETSLKIVLVASKPSENTTISVLDETALASLGLRKI